MSVPSVNACPVCGSGNAANATRCWVCGAAMSEKPTEVRAAPAAASSAPGAARSAQPERPATLVWVTVVAGIALVSLLIGVSLALEWPGLLVPYAFFVLVAFTGIGRTAWRSIARERAGEGSGVTADDVLHGIAAASILMAIILTLLFLVFVAAIVIFLAICFAMFPNMH